MRATIVVDDNIVLVDGKPQTVDCTPLVAEGKHAVQWYDSFGEVEFRSDENPEATRKPNEKITDISPYQSYIDAWNVENQKSQETKR